MCLVLIVGCSPIYKTKYSFTPPESKEGQKCVHECKAKELSCEKIEYLEFKNCHLEDEISYRDCKNRDKSEEWKKKNCGKGAFLFCDADIEKCEKFHRDCYQACGGTVTEYKKCYFFCD